MITINSFLHRDELHDIIRRWMYDEAQPGDADLITRLVYFNHIYVNRYLDAFSRMVFGGLHGGLPLATREIRSKGELKDVLVADPPCHDERIDALLSDYRLNPGRFYRETPFHGTLYFCSPDGDPVLVGTSRMKRVRRLAEKSARRIIDRMFELIKRHADALADERARLLGIPRESLLTAPEAMAEEFLRAEGRLVDDLRAGRPIAVGEGKLVINDVAGVKVTLEEQDQPRLKELMGRLPDCEIVEEERHAGRYNATNLIVRYRPRRGEMLAKPLGSRTLATMALRGLSPAEANRAFADFILAGEEEVYVEIILSTYREMLESEIGRCMHEDRIIEQRLRQQYRGPLAQNIQYLMEYLFIFPASHQVDLGELPIKIWNRYLPDYFEEILKRLFQIPLESFPD